MRAKRRKWRAPVLRPTELSLLAITVPIILLGFWLVVAAGYTDGLPATVSYGAMLPPLVVIAVLFGIHAILSARRFRMEQLIFPIMGLIFSIGLIMIWRLRGEDGVWQQILRGYLPGMGILVVFVIRPRLVEYLRRLAIPFSLIGLGLPFLTAIFGVVDETGARLALKIGPLPAIQTSEIIKFALLLFLAWYIERQGEEVVGRARPVGWLRLPAISYFVPGVLFVALGTLALVQMSDFGAVVILACLFVGMVYAGFETRVFIPVAAIGLALSTVAGLVLAYTWEVPAVIRYRFLAFLNPWSSAPVMINGQPSGFTIAQGPGYQIQQSIYAAVAGGLSGTGLGFGSPEYVPLAHSDFIFAAMLEEMGAVVGIAVLALFSILIFRILRTSVLLPEGQTFERLLLVGIAVHLFTQVFVMVGGTLNLIPLTGITIPFMSQGGTALLVNMMEIGIVLAVAQRLEGGYSG